MAPLLTLLWSVSWAALLLRHPTGAFATATAASSKKPASLLPSDDAARRNAFEIFNAVHSAMRQWGSSLNHNGMSLFLATVPEGQLLYHGGRESERVKGLNGTGAEWLAFELEHAQLFGSSWPMSRPGPPGVDEVGPSEGDPSATLLEWNKWTEVYQSRLHSRSFGDEAVQQPLGADEESDDGDQPPKGPNVPDFSRPIRVYFHTYRANRPLNLLYIDGMAAGKTSFGCLDTQDYLLLDWPKKGDDRNGFLGEMERAQGLCSLAKEWAWEGGQIDGFIRTEAGFEIIYCDFSEIGGLDVASIQASPFVNETGGLPLFSQVEFLRGVSQRYHGLPSGRIHVDWSSMLSAFFYDVNLTNPDLSRPELPRLVNTTREERLGIRARLQEIVSTRAGAHPRGQAKETINWQGIVDLIVTRFSQRLGQLVTDTSAPISSIARNMLPQLVYPYIDYSSPTEPLSQKLARCTQHYLSGALSRQNSWTPEDHSLYVAVETVTGTICKSLFEMQSVLYNGTVNDSSSLAEQDTKVRQIVDDLMGNLQWTTWRECDPCQNPDELCLVAMFPWGDSEDHFNPRCNKPSEVRMRNSYWMNRRRRGVEG